MREKTVFYRHNLNKKDFSFKYFYNDKNFLTYGNVCRNVEKKILNLYNKKYGFLSNSWTNAAIALAKSLNLNSDDEIIIPANTFVACANAFEWTGCKIVFADIDKNTMLLNINDCLMKITKKTKVIMPVHIYGNIFDTRQLRKKIRKNIIIIEDSAHALVGQYSDGKNLGYYSDYVIFSFYATKNITCGEGGALIGNNNKVINNAKTISNNGMTKNAISRFKNSKYNDWNVNAIGFKGLLNDLSASVLINQFKNIKKDHKNRKKIYDLYYKHLSKIKNILIPRNSNCIRRDYHLFPIGIYKKKFNRNKFFAFMAKNNINFTVNFRSILKLNFYKKKYGKQNCYNAAYWGNRIISLPFHSKLTEKNIIHITKIIKKYIYQD